LYPNATLTFVRTPDITADHHTANSLASYAPEIVLANSSKRKCGKIEIFSSYFLCGFTSIEGVAFYFLQAQIQQFTPDEQL
jgi:hypothetical protein